MQADLFQVSVECLPPPDRSLQILWRKRQRDLWDLPPPAQTQSLDVAALTQSVDVAVPG